MRSHTRAHHSPYLRTQTTFTTDDMPSAILSTITSILLLFLLSIFLISPILDSHVDATDGQKTNVVFVIDEESPVGSQIGSLAEKLALDITSREVVNFVPLTDLRLVNFNRTSGLITVRQRIDRECLCKEIGSCCPGQIILSPSLTTFHDAFSSDAQYSGCAIKMLVMDQIHRGSNAPQSQEHPLIQVIIYVNDLNDNPPSWSPDKLELEIPEHTVIGRKFQLPEATDPDHGPEHTVQNYRLIPSEALDHSLGARGVVSDAFELSSDLIERSPGSPYKFALGLNIKADLDREKQSTYNFLLIATDGGSPQLTGTLSVIVRITDINDQTPYFRQANPTIEISENTAVGMQIYTAVALDDDPSDANRLEYRLGSTASADVHRLFSVDSRTGVVSVSGEVDFESAPILPSKDAKDSVYNNNNNKYGYIIPIEVTDQAHIAEMKLRVHVLNVNDNPPTLSIQSPLQSSISKGEFYIREDAIVGSLIATITMTDADERGGVDPGFLNRASLPYCSTTNAFFSIQPLHSTMKNLFKLVTSKPLDHETKSTHGITIVCHDSGQPVISTKQHLTVRLEDVNDSPPIFEKSVYYARISEGLPVHTPIIKVHASDADTGEMADIRYRFVGNVRQMDYDPMVILDEKSGQIRSGIVFDREMMKSINFTVEAVDCGGGNRTSCGGRVNTAMAEVIVQIEDINDCAPEFDHQSYEFTIQECHISKIPVGKVHAVDRDADAKNNRVRYHINDDGNSGRTGGFPASRLFSITPTGEIYTNSVPIDREQVPILTFSVVATDSGEPPLSAFAAVVIRVEDINDNGPQWIFPPPGPQATNINISAYSTVGMVIARLEAIDPDLGANGQVEYEIIRGNSQKYFDLDSLSGTLYLAKALEINADGNVTNEHSAPVSFALSLKASDCGEPQKSNTSLLRITVQSAEAFSSDNHPSDGNRMSGKNQHLTNSQFKQQNTFVDRDLLVMIVMIIITLLVSVLLIMAIVLLRCRQIHSARNSGLDEQTDVGSAGRVGIVRVAQLKPQAWIPPSSQDTCAKSAFTLESSKSGAGAFDGQSHYMTSTGHFISADSTLQSANGTFDRFSPTLLVPHHPSISTSTFSDPSPTGAVAYTTKTLPENPSPCYIRQMCATLPNNATSVNTISSKNVSDPPGRCYMTLNPELYEVEYPYGQLKYHTGVYHQSSRPLNPSGGGCTTIMKSTPDIVDTEPPPQITTLSNSVEMPRVETQKRCRFKIDHSSSRLTPVLGNLDTSESTEETVDGVELEVDSMQMKRLRNVTKNSGLVGEDNLLVDIH